MNFSSPAFLLVFLPLLFGALGVARLATRRAGLQNAVLLSFSLAFYAYGSGVLIGLLFAVALIAWGAGRTIDARRGSGAAQTTARAAIAAIVALLLFFKYAGFLTFEVGLGAWMGAETRSFVSGIALPIGISFYVFQALSYVADVSAGRVGSEARFTRVLLYLAMVPQLVAGPIVRFSFVRDALHARAPGLEDLSQGGLRFVHGLFKKVVVADTLAVVASAGFAAPGELSTGAAWLATLCFTLQIYFDFSGYSDMAIGLGRMLGFRLPENFRRPYSAVTVTDFWRRWHMTLSSFFRDYVYIPLGGNRSGSPATYRNLLVVFVLTGLWHGAAWNFLAWGLFHGALLVAERALGGRDQPVGAARTAVRRGATQLLVGVGWVLFASSDLGAAGEMLARLLAFDGAPLAAAFEDLLSREFWAVLMAASLVFVVPPERVVGLALEASSHGRSGAFALACAWGVAALALSLGFVAAHEFSPFMYFQF